MLNEVQSVGYQKATGQLPNMTAVGLRALLMGPKTTWPSTVIVNAV